MSKRVMRCAESTERPPKHSRHPLTIAFLIADVGFSQQQVDGNPVLAVEYVIADQIESPGERNRISDLARSRQMEHEASESDSLEQRDQNSVS